jgi:hypothetical protein
VRACIRDHRISVSQFEHPKFNGCEIIP